MNDLFKENQYQWTREEYKSLVERCHEMERNIVELQRLVERLQNQVKYLNQKDAVY